MNIQLIRHATLYIEIGNAKFLVDPMLSEKNAMNPIGNCGNEIRIPMVDLPLSSAKLDDLLEKIDAVFVTHTHRDHWGDKAQELIRKDTPIFCQLGDEEQIRQQGFTKVTTIYEVLKWK